MNVERNFSLLAVGIGQIERRLLNGIVTLSTARDRARHYTWFDPADQGLPDMVVAMANNEEALTEIRNNYCDERGNPLLPVIVLGMARVANDSFHHIRGPLVTTRVLDELDRTPAHFHA
ncbi:MAG: hypothetical protein DWQ09_06500 [Proteobacteria bacterium]|nr:MAG: hypothetical protein DWQ09_06500 [Pseudomonadota bacterium]QKK11584.1 MAG: hypothetical protein HND59_08285 [Pseudomonadota bacterium]